MPTSLTKDQRKLLSDITLEAREVADTAARAALENLAVHEGEYRGHMTVDQRQLRNRLRARGRALGDRLDQRTGAQTIDHVAESAAYEHWHRLLFTRFLAENHLLHTDAEHDSVPVTLEDCNDLAPELGARDGFELACRFASETLPGVFRRDDPVLELRLAPNHEVQLRRLVDRLHPEIFRADDALGWTYQFWQSKRKEQINKSGIKVGADELPAVTQLFTEDYMVEFLLHNSIGAWWAGKQGPVRAETEEQARAAVALAETDGMPAITWDYLRFIQADYGTWRPAAGTFDGWPRHAAEIRFLDPCMGSGHFLVFALPILARLRMEEEGLGAAEAVAAVLRDNLHGLEIDERCTQIAAFNVALTAWKFGGYQPLPTLHLACSGLAPNTREGDWLAIADDNEKLRNSMERLYRLFRQAALLGSLINPRAGEAELLEAGFQEFQPLLEKALAQETKDDTAHEMAVTACGLAKAAELLAGQFTLVATNVPYLGRSKQDDVLATFCEASHREARTELATCFVDRCLHFCSAGGSSALVTPQNWLFLRSYKSFRKSLLVSDTWNLVVRLGPAAFRDMNWWAANTTLLAMSHEQPGAQQFFAGFDVSANRDPDIKADLLNHCPIQHVAQSSQLARPDSIITITAREEGQTLADYVTISKGVCTGDRDRFARQFWEIPRATDEWSWFRTAVSECKLTGGCENILFWQSGSGEFVEFVKARLGGSTGAWIRGEEAWGKRGIAIGRMRNLPCTLYAGELFDDNSAVVVPKDPSHLATLWDFINSPDFREALRELNQKVSVDNTYFGAIPLDIESWIEKRGQAETQLRMESRDPTQWLYNGHLAGADQPLQVAAARLLGYLWPRQTGSEFPDCPALGPDGLEDFADADGIACLPPINKEQPAAARLRNLLAAAFGADWSPSRERDLLAAAGAKQTNLEDWLRDAFFEQHYKLFKSRPFVWHIWDGRKDGFHALVNYHRLDHAALQKLTYSYLGDWIRQQDADAKADKPGAAERLGAA